MDVSLDEKVPVKFWKSSGSEIRIRTPDPDQIVLGGGMRSLTALVQVEMSARMQLSLYVYFCMQVHVFMFSIHRELSDCKLGERNVLFEDDL